MNIIPAIKNYSWALAHPKKNLCHQFLSLPESIPIAELWYGTHDHGHSYIDETGEPLQSFLGQINMNFLFKILSVGKPLSIQIHPDDLNAAQLHTDYPHLYPDSNAKPEIAIALSDRAFAFCGIRPYCEIQKDILNSYHDIFDSDIVARWKNYTTSKNMSILLKDTFINIFELPTELYAILQSRLFNKHQIFRWLDGFYPNDRGCVICIILLNYISLKKYDALCIPPHMIHCYIYGNFFECMKKSDNVIRIGLTPKTIDFPTFFKIANFKETPPQTFMISYQEKSFMSYTFQPLPQIRIYNSSHDENKTDIMIPCIGLNEIEFMIVLAGGNGCRVNQTYDIQDHRVYIFDLFRNSKQLHITRKATTTPLILILLSL